MEFSFVIRQLQLDGSPDLEISERFWEDSGKTFPGTGNIDFLTPEKVAENFQYTGVDGELLPEVRKLAADVNGGPELSRWFWHQHYVLEGELTKVSEVQKFPLLKNLLGEKAFTYNFLLSLSLIPKALEFHGARGIPEKVTRDTFADMAVWVRHNQNTLNVFGLSERHLGWTQSYLRGMLFQLGRLQYNQASLGFKAVVFRNRETGVLLTVSEPEVEYNSEGLRDGADDNWDKTGGWLSEYKERGGKLVANPILPTGFAMRKTVILDLSEWEKIMDTESPMLNIHIPAEGGAMTVEACADSIQQATEFFPKYFPEYSFKGFKCYSWFLDISFEKFLAETSNIIKFQRAGYLVPTAGGSEETLLRVFGEQVKKTGLAAAPRKSSMQRAVAEFVESGGQLRPGGCFVLTEDLPWGSNKYRNDLSILKRDYL